jgi:hypothetical protein
VTLPAVLVAWQGIGIENGKWTRHFDEMHIHPI